MSVANAVVCDEKMRSLGTRHRSTKTDRSASEPTVAYIYHQLISLGPSPASIDISIEKKPN